MNFLKVLFGNAEASPEDEKRQADARQFDLMKYDGVKAMRIGRFDYAIRCFEEALNVQDDPETRTYLSRALVQTGDYEQALQQLEQMMASQPQDSQLALQAAQVAFLMEDYERMQQYCERALDIDPDDPHPHYFMARACKGKGDLVGVIAWLTKCLTKDDSFADAYLMRGQTLLEMGDVASVEADVQWLLDHAGDNEDVLLLAARTEKGKGNAAAAIDYYNKVNEANPFQVDAYRERGQLRYETGDKQGAKEDMQRVLELNPEEMADVSGDYSAEGIEQKVKRAYSVMNPFGL